VYASFNMVFPASPQNQALQFQLNNRNAYGLAAGTYQLQDLYQAQQTPPVYHFFLNVCNERQEILASLSGQLNSSKVQLDLSLSPEHLQSAQAPALLKAVKAQFARKQNNWYHTLQTRAQQMYQTLLKNPKAETPAPGLEELQLLKTDALEMLLAHYQDPEDQEALIHALLEEIRQLMLQELENHRKRQQPPPEANIIRFPLERRQSSTQNHWLDIYLELTDLPEIWRRIRVPDSLTLTQLHQVIQTAMGWRDQHMWRFISSKGEYVSYGRLEPCWEDEQDADQIQLKQVLTRKGSRLDYEYDFGDSWYHRLKVESRHSAEVLTTTDLLCLEGQKSCPPENCGGFLGYREILRILHKKRPNKSEQELIAWLGNFSPDVFCLDKINLKLQNLCPSLL